MKDVLLRVKDQIAEDNLSIVSAGVAFWGMLALFPALAALVSLWALFADPAQVQQQVQSMMSVIPADAARIIGDQLTALTSGGKATASVAAVISVLLALYGATKGTNALMEALNIVYDETEERGIVVRTLTSVALTALGVIVAIVAIAAVGVVPALLDLLQLPMLLHQLVAILRWPLIALFMVTFLGVLYRFAPSRPHARWRWVTPGAVFATVAWLVVSALFSLYVGRFGSYQETYGALGAVVVLLMWMYLTAFVVLIGGELNAETERRTGDSEPRGERGAYDAAGAPT